MTREEEVLQRKIESVRKLIELCGGTQYKLAKKFGVSKQTVNKHWMNHGVPIKHLYQVELHFKKQIKKEEVWPDYFEKRNKKK